jgi:hypothetical protein
MNTARNLMAKYRNSNCCNCSRRKILDHRQEQQKLGMELRGLIYQIWEQLDIILQDAGTQTAGLAFAGNPGPAVTNVTEEWTGEIATAGSKTLTTS